MDSTGAQALLDRLITEHKPGYTLQREFWTDPGIYRLDLERIWRRGWLFAVHTCQVKRPGDYLVFELDTDSVVIIRGKDEAIHALHNTCRHRGMRVCQQEAGHAHQAGVQRHPVHGVVPARHRPGVAHPRADEERVSS